MVDIHDELCLAVSAPEDQPVGVGVRAGLLVRGLLAVGTDIPSVPYDQFSRFHSRLQVLPVLSSFITLYSKIVRARTRGYI